MGTHTKKLAILQHLRTHIKAKYEKGVRQASSYWGGIQGQRPPNFFCAPPKFLVPRKICFKNIIKTKIVPSKNVFCPSKPQNLATGLVWERRSHAFPPHYSPGCFS